jgi:hypothetical protein
VLRVWDMLLFSTPSSTNGSSGILLFTSLSLLHSSKAEIKCTDSMCRAISKTREVCAKISWSKVVENAGLSVHSFLDIGKLRKDIKRMDKQRQAQAQAAAQAQAQAPAPTKRAR